MRPVPKPAAKADALPELYKSVRAHTEELCAPLEIEDYIPQPTVDVSPPKWNIAHTTWFFEEMILKKFASGYEVFDPDFGFLFNSYYNTIGERTARDNRGDLSRPTVKKVFEFRRYVDEKMLELLAANESEELRELVILGCNHEQQHQELFLTDLKYTFSVNPLFPAYREGYAPEDISEPPASAGDLSEPPTPLLPEEGWPKAGAVGADARRISEPFPPDPEPFRADPEPFFAPATQNLTPPLISPPTAFIFSVNSGIYKIFRRAVFAGLNLSGIKHDNRASMLVR